MEFPQSCRRAGPLHLVCMSPLLGISSPPSFVPNLLNPHSSFRTQLHVTFFQTLSRPFQSGSGAYHVCDLGVPGRPSYYIFHHILSLFLSLDSKMLYTAYCLRCILHTVKCSAINSVIQFLWKKYQGTECFHPSRKPAHTSLQPTPTPRSKSSSAFHHRRFLLLILERSGIRHCAFLCAARFLPPSMLLLRSVYAVA